MKKDEKFDNWFFENWGTLKKMYAQFQKDNNRPIDLDDGKLPEFINHIYHNGQKLVEHWDRIEYLAQKRQNYRNN